MNLKKKREKEAMHCPCSLNIIDNLIKPGLFAESFTKANKRLIIMASFYDVLKTNVNDEREKKGLKKSTFQ